MPGIQFIYDGECPVCTYAAHAFRIRQAAGELTLIDARTEGGHPLVQEVNRRGLDLDEGMVIHYEGTFYHGADALHLMALVGSETGWYNKANALLFRSKTLSKILYPVLRAGRNTLIFFKGVPKIDNLGKRKK